ncbi:MAG: hypothetical protein AAF125_18725 [Chloroflexota bacterium]
MSTVGFLFFVVFAIIQVLIYLSIRRGWLAVRATATAGILTSTVAALLMSLTSGNTVAQALFVALLMGGLISGGILMTAVYFARDTSQPPQ